MGRSHVAKVAEARLEQINRYCQVLAGFPIKTFMESFVGVWYFHHLMSRAH